jgi:hypothetical protein
MKYENICYKYHGRPRHRLKDNLKMDVRKTGYEDTKWILLVGIKSSGRFL